ncbi:MAG: abortive infection family protein [Alphaproteobacteria bacterium]|nr:abortive infection family protein [Alphaproteobacteria bacterium]
MPGREPDDTPDEATPAETVRRLLRNPATIAQGIAELRNQYGAGHGKTA